MVFEHERARSELQLWAIGATDGDPVLLKQGAFAASYIFCIDYARQRGIATVDLRGCRPSLHDTLLRYKRKWSAVLRDKPDNVYEWLVRWNTIEGVVAGFLGHTSLIFRDEDGFSAIHADPTRTDDALRINGLRGIYDPRTWRQTCGALTYRR